MGRTIVSIPCEREGCNGTCVKPQSEVNRNKRLNRPNFCSRRCAISKAVKTRCSPDEGTIRVCTCCSAEFKPSSGYLLCPSCRSTERRKTCPKCGKSMNRKSKVCRKCFPVHFKRKTLPEGTRRMKAGYVMIYIPSHPRAKNNGGYVFEHILVMEKKLGRYLEEGENVHHLYGVKDDNRIEHLELWVKPQPTGARAEDVLEWAIKIVKRYKPKLLK